MIGSKISRHFFSQSERNQTQSQFPLVRFSRAWHLLPADWFIELLPVLWLVCVSRKLHQRWRWWQRERASTTARAAHFFCTFFWPQLHDHKRPSFTFYGGRDVKKTTFFLFFEPKRSSFEFISRKIFNVWNIEGDRIRAIIIFKQREFIL